MNKPYKVVSKKRKEFLKFFQLSSEQSLAGDEL